MSDQMTLGMMLRLIDDLTRRVEILEDALAQDEGLDDTGPATLDG